MTRIEILRRLNENDRDLQSLEQNYNNFQRRNQQLQRRLDQDFSSIISIQGNSINIKNRNQEQYKPCGKDCSICLEKVRNDGCKTSCKHHFHKKCLNTWKNIGKNTCPNCRSKL